MTTVQLEKALNDYTKDLPQYALQEIFDFVQFIYQRVSEKSRGKPAKKVFSLSDSQTSHMVEEFRNYKQLYPSE